MGHPPARPSSLPHHAKSQTPTPEVHQLAQNRKRVAGHYACHPCSIVLHPQPIYGYTMTPCNLSASLAFDTFPVLSITCVIWPVPAVDRNTVPTSWTETPAASGTVTALSSVM